MINGDIMTAATAVAPAEEQTCDAPCFCGPVQHCCLCSCDLMSFSKPLTFQGLMTTFGLIGIRPGQKLES